MSNMYLLATSISFVYFVFRFIEIRTSKEEAVPLKNILKDTVVVFVASLLGICLLDSLTPFIDETSLPKQGGGGKSMAFTDNPNF